MFEKYKKIFSLNEFEESFVSRFSFYASLLTFLVSFGFLSFNSFEALGTKLSYLNNRYACPPYFQDCGKYFFLDSLPYSFSYTSLYIFLFALILLAFYFGYKGRWVQAHLSLLVLFIWKILISFVFAYGAGAYDYYDLVFVFILLFLPYKDFFLRRAFILLYFLAATIKFTDGWIAGTHFSSLISGLPFIPESLIPLSTNIIIIFQILECWLLLSKNKYLQTFAFGFSLFFHLYAGIFVGYRYLISAIPPLCILFFEYWKVREAEIQKKYNYLKLIPGYLFFMLLIGLQLFASLDVVSDRHYTLERNRFGLYMFEANHQCVYHMTVYYNDGRQFVDEYENNNARFRCDPYRTWFKIKQSCLRNKDEIERIDWTFDHSVNGEPFRRIIDERNVCELEYTVIKHNKWIKDKTEGEIIGYPVKNFYY